MSLFCPSRHLPRATIRSLSVEADIRQSVSARLGFLERARHVIADVSERRLSRPNVGRDFVGRRDALARSLASGLGCAFV